MKTGPLLAAGLLLAGPMFLSTVGCDPPRPYASCGSIGTIANSDAGVWRIEAHSTGCSTARTLALYWHDYSAGRPLTWNGVWRCTGPVVVPRQLGQDVWCNGPAGGVVTFTNVG